jgi:hypothetical protein
VCVLPDHGHLDYRWAPNLVSAWLTLFAIGVVVAVPTAILAAPRAQRLVSRLTGGTVAVGTARPRNTR